MIEYPPLPLDGGMISQDDMYHQIRKSVFPLSGIDDIINYSFENDVALSENLVISMMHTYVMNSVSPSGALNRFRNLPSAYRVARKWTIDPDMSVELREQLIVNAFRNKGSFTRYTVMDELVMGYNFTDAPLRSLVRKGIAETDGRGNYSIAIEECASLQNFLHFVDGIVTATNEAQSGDFDAASCGFSEVILDPITVAFLNEDVLDDVNSTSGAQYVFDEVVKLLTPQGIGYFEIEKYASLKKAIDAFFEGE